MKFLKKVLKIHFSRRLLFLGGASVSLQRIFSRMKSVEQYQGFRLEDFHS